jgi:hypothetical protein
MKSRLNLYDIIVLTVPQAKIIDQILFWQTLAWLGYFLLLGNVSAFKCFIINVLVHNVFVHVVRDKLYYDENNVMSRDPICITADWFSLLSSFAYHELSNIPNHDDVLGQLYSSNHFNQIRNVSWNITKLAFWVYYL